jgi:hypothetical protein
MSTHTNKRKSREYDDENNNENVPPTMMITNENITTKINNANLHKYIRLDYCAIDNELQSRCDELRMKTDIEIQHLKLAYERQLAKLPKKVREMTLKTFVKQYGQDLEQVTMENIQTRQNEFEKWVATTPRLPMTRKREILSTQTIEALTNPTSQQRLTRAQARKQGIAI